MRVDSHMHTPLCGHAVGEPLEYAMAAAKQGIDIITITCHIPMEWEAFGQQGIRMQRSELGQYTDMVREAAEKARDFGVEVLCGIEAEVYPEEDKLTAMDEILGEYDFDFVLGSLHAQCQSYRLWLAEHGAEDDHAKIELYFRDLKQGVLSGRYDSMSHPDVIRTYGVVNEFKPAEHESVIREFLQAVVEQDICMEVNTSGLNKGDYEVQPDPLILDWAAALGVKLTIGSDSHLPAAVGQHFPTVQPMLRSKGFKDLHYFRQRQRIRIDMPQHD